MPDKVFLVNHVHLMPSGDEDVKLIGVYQSQLAAMNAVERAKRLPGFLSAQDGFAINEYEMGKDHWVEGYFTWVPENDGLSK